MSGGGHHAAWRSLGEYTDAAISGGTTNRINLQRLLKDAKRKDFDTVLVDDLSRLSRDMGDTWRIVYGDLATAGVNLFDCTAGVASDAKGSRLVFGALSLVNDTFRELDPDRDPPRAGGQGAGRVRDRRPHLRIQDGPGAQPADPREGPEGAGHPPRGGDGGPPDLAMAADGVPVKRIAAQLNEDGILAPHDGGKGNKIPAAGVTRPSATCSGTRTTSAGSPGTATSSSKSRDPVLPPRYPARGGTRRRPRSPSGPS